MPTSEDDLVAAALNGRVLTGADLSGVDLTGANLCLATLRGANLAGARLVGANLTWADLTGADLRGADLTGANMKEVELDTADLTDAILTDVTGIGEPLSEARRADLADLRKLASSNCRDLSGAKPADLRTEIISAQQRSGQVAAAQKAQAARGGYERRTWAWAILLLSLSVLAIAVNNPAAHVAVPVRVIVAVAWIASAATIFLDYIFHGDRT